MDALVEWGEKTKKPSKKRTDEKGGDKIPKEKLDDARLARIAFLPGDFGVKKIGENGGECIRNHTVEPKEFVVTKYDAGEKGVN